MIKELYILSKADRALGNEKFRTVKKSYARLKRFGYSGMRERLEKEIRALKEENYLLYYRLSGKFGGAVLRLLFASVFLLSMLYILFIKSELYLSSASVIVKDINKNPQESMGLSLLGVGTSTQMQDAFVLEQYLASFDVFDVLDRAFRLGEHYHSEALDPFERLYASSRREDLLELYNKRLQINYDEISGILTIGFLHTSAEEAKKIVAFLVARAESQLNHYNQLRAQKQLTFIEGELEKSRAKLEASIRELELFQNENRLLDPAVEAQSTNAIIANLEANLVEKKARYNQLLSYMNRDNIEVVQLDAEIREIKKALRQLKSSLSGKGEGKLNATMVAYEKLIRQVDFDTEVYKQNLAQYEVAKVESVKEAKTLTVLTQPNLPDDYAKPEKLRESITLLLVLLLGYGILSLVITIVRDHKD